MSEESKQGAPGGASVCEVCGREYTEEEGHLTGERGPAACYRLGYERLLEAASNVRISLLMLLATPDDPVGPATLAEYAKLLGAAVYSTKADATDAALEKQLSGSMATFGSSRCRCGAYGLPILQQNGPPIWLIDNRTGEGKVHGPWTCEAPPARTTSVEDAATAALKAELESCRSRLSTAEKANAGLRDELEQERKTSSAEAHLASDVISRLLAGNTARGDSRADGRLAGLEEAAAHFDAMLVGPRGRQYSIASRDIASRIRGLAGDALKAQKEEEK